MANTLKVTQLNNKRIFVFESKIQFLNYIEDKKQILIALNAEKLNVEDKRIEELTKHHIGYADGIGAVFALRRKGLYSTKIAGAEFWLDIIKRYQGIKSFYFIGSTSKVIEQTISKLKIEFPKIEILGYRNGFLEEGDNKKLIRVLLDKKPDVVFVAMGSPKQEILMDELINNHSALYMGLGGSFDVYVGLKNRAPIIYQKLGLEWMYRLLKEPTRWRRQLTYISFAVKVILNRI